ncbi:peptidoglycan bridge formation glycyltransferase FemA/FemB family protein [Candidatus Uhrbacteria bacterium]|nr:peptidoglycan bridge formation glycyltransferase FemA/FemB family protein [Candidatus Uhrbacteria bacterium]
MDLLEITSRPEWDDWQSAQTYAQFLQSWAWGEFRESRGSKVRRYALRDGAGEWLAALQLEYRKKKFGLGYWYAPRGPVFSSKINPEKRPDLMLSLCEGLLMVKDLKKQALFWRFEPVSELSNPEGLVPLSFRRSKAGDPTSTIILDLDKSEDNLLKDMHEKTRYNIRLAAKRGVTVRLAKDARDVEAFLDLAEETSRRDGFVQYPRQHLKDTYSVMHANGQAEIRLAELQGKVLCANMELSFGDTVTYLHGASSSENRNVMAPFALHWVAIQEARRRGFKLYDFWGANPLSKAMYYYKPSWDGVTRFKRGWGGRQFDLVGTWDLPFNVFLYRLAFIKQFFRG